MRRNEAIELVDSTDYKNFIGFYSYCKATYESPVFIPSGWEATMALEHASVERFHKKLGNLDGVIYGEGGNIKPEFRGKNIGAKTM